MGVSEHVVKQLQESPPAHCLICVFVLYVFLVFVTQNDAFTIFVNPNIKDIKSRRIESQPIKEKTGGSTFANPAAEDIAAAGLPDGTKVWQLIDRAGCRGLQIGGAQMSELHCNFMINTGEASGADLENLGEEVRRRVYEDCGIKLRWEIKRIGEYAGKHGE